MAFQVVLHSKYQLSYDVVSPSERRNSNSRIHQKCHKVWNTRQRHGDEVGYVHKEIEEISKYGN